MSYNQVHSGAGQEGALGDPWFAGNHGPEGEFNSLKGTALEARELSYSEQGGNVGPERLNQETSKSDWRTYGPVQTGTFDPDALTHGTDKNMPK